MQCGRVGGRLLFNNSPEDSNIPGTILSYFINPCIMSLRFLYHLFIKCARFGRSKGFGIQSPTHYSFVRYVINERYPYYAYNDLKDMFPGVSKIDRAHLELLFRLSNWRQPSIVTLLGCDTHIYREYIHRGCNKSLIHDSFQDRGISDYVII